MPNYSDNYSDMIASVFDGAGAIEKIVSMDKVEELQDKVEELQDKIDSSKAATGQLTNAEIAQAIRMIRTKPVLRDYKKIGRNDTCPCGSGKKYKNCCLKTGKYETRHQIGE